MRIHHFLLLGVLLFSSTGCQVIAEAVIEGLIDDAFDSAFETSHERRIRKDYDRLDEGKPLKYHDSARDLRKHSKYHAEEEFFNSRWCD